MERTPQHLNGTVGRGTVWRSMKRGRLPGIDEK